MLFTKALFALVASSTIVAALPGGGGDRKNGAGDWKSIGDDWKSNGGDRKSIGGDNGGDRKSIGGDNGGDRKSIGGDNGGDRTSIGGDNGGDRTSIGGDSTTSCTTEYYTTTSSGENGVTYYETKTVTVPYTYTTNEVSTKDPQSPETKVGELTTTYVETYYKTKTKVVPYTTVISHGNIEYSTYPKVYTTQKEDTKVYTKTKDEEFTSTVVYPTTKCPSATGKGW